MRIGMIAPPWLQVPPTGYGGIEMVVDSLARGFQAHGHDVVMVAAGGSTCPVTLVETLPSPPKQMGSVALELRHAALAYEALSSCDVIHDHTIMGPTVGVTTSRAPIVSTIHSDLSPPYVSIYEKGAAEGVRHVFISKAQRRTATFSTAAPVIHHGLDVEQYPYEPKSSSYLLFLGRMHPDKGLHDAIAAARRAKVPLVIAAKMRDRLEHEYFTSEVRPHLGPNVEYVGEASLGRKVELLRHARALVFPVQWAEPFGLVMIEALACGTPVLAYPNGAVPEVVEHGVTGFLVRDIDGLVGAISRVGDLDRAGCRASVEHRFSAIHMVENHLRYFSEVVVATSAITDEPAERSLEVAG